MGDINTIYIISKGRPKCTTARTLTRIDWPGEWYIVCGSNDETIPEYQKNWGDHVLVFDWDEEVKHTDLLDNFGVEKKASGAVPARNATREIARQRGDLRHWQFDDDYESFQMYNPETCKNEVVSKDKGNVQRFYDELYKLAEFGLRGGLANVGFSLATREGAPYNRYTFSRRVYNTHNMPTDDSFVEWRGRMNDDTINGFDAWNYGQAELAVHYLQVSMTATQQEQGGLTDLYQQDGTVRKTAYMVMTAPSASKLVVRFGRYHHAVEWTYLCPKILNEKWRKC